MSSGARDRRRLVADVMQTDVYVLRPDTSVESALDVVRRRGVDFFLVVEDGVLGGVLSSEDLLRAEKAARVGSCATSPVPCVHPHVSVEDAVSVMSGEAFSFLAVVDDGMLVGVVTRDDLPGGGLGEVSADDRPEADLCAACGTARGVRPRGPVRDLLLCRACAARVVSPVGSEVA